MFIMGRGGKTGQGGAFSTNCHAHPRIPPLRAGIGRLTAVYQSFRPPFHAGEFKTTRRGELEEDVEVF